MQFLLSRINNLTESFVCLGLYKSVCIFLYESVLYERKTNALSCLRFVSFNSMHPVWMLQYGAEMPLGVELCINCMNDLHEYALRLNVICNVYRKESK